MPPSPAMRYSPGREPRADNHKRGLSLGSGMPLKQKDDDLALFNEVQSRERDNFLLQSDDNFEDIFTNKLRHLSDYKLGINIPAPGESSDLLHAEDDKNDYEWLLTPPDTPLFPSLDDEAPQANLAQRGRPRTQPISISRSSTMEKSYRSSRGSASPNRLSPSPRSNSSTYEGRGRASSAPSSSPPTSLRPASASSRPSPPPSRKPSMPIPRASTPTPRRLSTGSNGTMSTSGVRGVSPVKTSRGNSASPKVRAWQSNIPGFSTEVPPNLRTSLADRPASYVRGSSPASRNSRQSMSPTASRSISSSHSKGSVASSADDDVESLPSVIVGGACHSNSRRAGGFPNNKASLSKKPNRTVSSSSAPKRSFDLALRQMDHRKGPQNMFRPLLSSVPSSTFYAGITSSGHRTMISRNSSMTTSSNASSGLGTSGAHDPEVSQDDATSGFVKPLDCNVNDEVFVLEEDDTLNGGTANELREENSIDLGDHGTGTSEVCDPDTNGQKGMLICLRCDCEYVHIGPVEKDTNLCLDCMKLCSPLTVIDPVTSGAVAGSETEAATMVEPQMVVVESPEGAGKVKARSGQHSDVVRDGQSTYGEPIWNFLAENSLSRPRSEECEPKVDSLEGAGISILLKRSSSIKGAIVRNTNFSASSISYDDLSYARDGSNSMRSVSASSSVDFGTVRQTDARCQRQLSSPKSETETYKFDLNTKHQRSGSSMSGTSTHAFHPSSLATSTLDSFGRDVQENTEETSTGIENDNEVEDLEPNASACALQTCTFVEDESPNPCVNGSDVAEVPLDAISEGESDHASKRDVSRGSTSSIEELQDSRVTSALDKDVAVPAEDNDLSSHESNIMEESMVLVGPQGEPKGRSLTLEEATDTILFCSSIVHQLAYDAATMALEKENPSDSVDDDGSWPLVPATRKSDLSQNELQSGNTAKRSSKSQRSRQRKVVVESDTTKAPNTTDTEGKITDQLKTRIVGVRDSNTLESKKPPLLESKCNCAIM